MSSDPQGHTSQQPITHPALSSSASDKTTTGSTRSPSESGHADTSSTTVSSPPTPPLPPAHTVHQASAPPHPAASAHSATSSSPHPGNADSTLQSQLQPTPSGAHVSFNQPVPSPPVPQITTVSLTMSAPPLGHHSGDEQRLGRFTSSPLPISPSSPHTPGSIDAPTTSAGTSFVQNITSAPVLVQQIRNAASTVPASTSVHTPGPVTATPILPSGSPNAPIIASTQAQSLFHNSGPGPAASATAGPSRKPTQESIQESEKEYEDDAEQSHGNVPPPVQTQTHEYVHASVPVACPSGQTNAAIQMQSQRTTPPQELPSSSTTYTRSAVTPTNMGGSGNGAGVGAGHANAAGNGYNSSTLATRNGQRGQDSSPGRRTSTRAVSYTEPPLPSRAIDRYPMPVANPSQPVPSPGVLKSLPLPPLAHHGSGSGDLVMSPQPDATAMHRPELDWAVPYMPGSHPTGQGNGNGNGMGMGMGMQGMPGGMGAAAGGRPGSRRDESRRGSANGGAGAHRRSMSMAGTLVPGGGERLVEERLQPTLEAAERELMRARRTAKLHGWALNVAIGAQVVLGALTTGVAAATTGKHTSIATSILGGLSTLAASYLAKARGSGEPDVSALRARELESFIRDLQAFMLDYGHLTTSAAGGEQAEHEAMVARYRRRFEEIMGNALEGVEDTMKAEKQMAEMKSAVASVREREKGKMGDLKSMV